MKRKLVVLVLILLMVGVITVACKKSGDDIGKEIDSNGISITEENDTISKEDTSSDVSSTGYRAPDADNVNPKEVFPIVKTPTKLTFAMASNPKVEDYGTNQFTLYLEEKTGVDIEFDFLPGGGETLQKAMLMFASNELPDVFVGVGFSDITILDYGTQGMITPLNDLIEIYGVEMQNMWKKAVEDKNLDKSMTFADGNIYYVPKYSEQTQNTYSIRAYVYEPWLKKLGLEIPTTTEEYYNMLVAFRDQDPNGNGKQDEIPLIGNKGGVCHIPKFFINSFIYDSNNHLMLNDSKVDVSFNKPEFKEALIWVNKLVEEDLLDPMTFTQDESQLKVLMGQPEVIVGSTSLSNKTGVLDRNIGEMSQRSDDYVPIMPLEGPNGIAYTYPGSAIPQPAYVITSECKNTAAAYRVGDFMLSEEATLFSRFGIEGEDWEIPEEGIIGYNGEQAKLAYIREVWGMSSHNVNWQFANPGFIPLHVFDTIVRPENLKEYNYAQFTSSIEMSKYAPDPEEVLPRKLSYTLEEMDEMAMIEATITTYVEENITRFIVGDRSFGEWDDYIAEFDRLQLDKYIDIVQTAYDRTMGN